MNGYVAGFGFRQGDATNFSDILTNELPTDVVIQTKPEGVAGGRVFAIFNFRSTDAESLAHASAQFGDPLDNNPAQQSAFISDGIFLAAQNATADAGKGQINGSNASVVGIMGTLPVLGLDTQGVPVADACVCEFVKWGTWIALINSPEAGRDILVPTGFWVAGKLPDVTDPSPSGVASFSGAALGFVQSQGEQAFRRGTFTNDYNFSQRTGQVNMNFDGKTFGGTVNAAAGDWRSYSGSLSGSGLAGSVNGSFYGNRDVNGQLQVPKETAGNFNVGNSGYAASGIFIGRR
jgi:hypothetical protein